MSIGNEDLDLRGPGRQEQKVINVLSGYVARLTGWQDLTSNIISRGTGPTDPAWGQIGTSAFWGYNFDVDDQVWMIFHVPHDYIPNTDVFFHAHWLPDGVNAQPVKWEWAIASAKGFNQEAFNLASPTTVNIQEDSPEIIYQHMTSEVAVGVDLGITETDTLVLVRLKRITNGGTDNADGIFLLTSDVHYQSRGESTPNKAPNFYA